MVQQELAKGLAWSWELRAKLSYDGSTHVHLQVVMISYSRQVLHRSNCFYVWKFVVNVWNEVKNSLFWSIRDGQFVNFWNDVWVSELGPLKFHFNGNGYLDESIRVCDAVNTNGS